MSCGDSRLTSGFLGESQTFILGSEMGFLFICLLFGVCVGKKGKQILGREMIQLVAV